jgi:hypothetical protein
MKRPKDQTREQSMDGYGARSAGAPPAPISVAGSRWSAGTAIRAAIAALSFGAAAVHGAVIGDHFREFWLYGIFFVGVTVIQVLWGVLVLVRPTRRTLVLGGVGSGSIALVWLLSRTAGIPIGPNGGGREAAGLLDSLATVLEVGILIGVVVLTRTLIGRRPLSLVRTILSGIAAWLGVASITVAALLNQPAGEEVEVATRRSGISGFVRPHLIHFVLFLCALAAASVYAVFDRRKMRQAPEQRAQVRFPPQRRSETVS